MKCSGLVFQFCLALGGAAVLPTSPALAHGASPGSSGGGTALLIFPVAAILFAFFLVFTRRRKGWSVLVTGGAGYIGSALVPRLLQHGHRVVVLDPQCEDNGVFETYQDHENLRQIPGDFTDRPTLDFALRGCDAVIHLACITGRSRRGADPALVRATNRDAFGPLLGAAKSAGVKRFILASSFGLADTADKARCEQLLEDARAPGFVTCAVRAATVCGRAASQRLDNGVNALIKDGFTNGHIQLDGDTRQQTPHIHVDDLVAFYLALLNQPDARIDSTIEVPADGWTDAETMV